MSVLAGDQLGPYKILAPIGKGGMGEVFRAHDPRLERDVAIKVSAERFSERFEREARAIAALNHPNICQLYDVGPDYLVMELIEGPTLDERLREGALEFDEAMAVGGQIAGALQAAHEKGITHRDLKPANIKLTPGGTVKVLDFGLAKMVGKQTAASSVDSPTISMAATQAGVILGTAAYMSPEQARGKPVDARSDIWAFGVVLYEMLTGQRLFRGEDLTETLASVVKEQPSLADAPRRARRLLEACLQKDPRKRLQAIGDMRLLLEDEQAVETVAPAPRRSGALPWVAAAAVSLVCAALAFVHFRETPPVERTLQVSIALPENSTANYLQISPDGRRLLLLLIRSGLGQLYVRPLDSAEFQPLPGTASARTPFWSPNGRSIGFFADNKLKVISAAGGPVQVLCGEAGTGGGAAWSRKGIIIFGSGSNGRGPFLRVDAKGGACTPLSKQESKLTGGFPAFLPDGEHFFYTGGVVGDEASTGVRLGTLDAPLGKKVLSDKSSVIYSPAGRAHGAHLLFLRENTLMAQPFDEKRLEVSGDPFAVAPHGSNSLTIPQVEASVAADGTLVFLAGRSRDSQLTWFDRAGKELGKVGPQADQTQAVFSPDGVAVAVTRAEAGVQPAVWFYDLARGSESRLTSPESRGLARLWSPDSTRLWFAMDGPEGSGMYEKDFKSGKQELIDKIDPTKPWIPSDWSRDGRFIVYTQNDPKTRADVWYDSTELGRPSGKPVKLLGTEANESQGQFSPDGKWLAYVSDETGRGEVYIRAFPAGSAVWRVSVGGGAEPRWRSDGKELYFVSRVIPSQGGVMAVSVEPDGRNGLRTGPPAKLFDIRAPMWVPAMNLWPYSPHPDGKRFLVNALAETGTPTINVITNWQQSAPARPDHSR
jgi:serine/threonine protein kinase